jgi:D-glycerate 3-kinase
LEELWLLRPRSWSLPHRWRFQAEARQRRAGGATLAAEAVERLVRASLCSLPPELYQDPLLTHPTDATAGVEAVAVGLLDGRRRLIGAQGLC